MHGRASGTKFVILVWSDDVYRHILRQNVYEAFSGQFAEASALLFRQGAQGAVYLIGDENGEAVISRVAFFHFSSPRSASARYSRAGP